MTDHKAEAVEAALNAACREIQTRLGVESGDVAGLYFSGGEPLEAFRAALGGYYDAELRHAEPAQPVVLTANDARIMALALRSSESTWRQWSESIANQEAADGFARQSARAGQLADMMESAGAVTVTEAEG